MSKIPSSRPWFVCCSGVFILETDVCRVLAWKKESRRRNLFFTLPAAFPLSPHIRMVEDDISYISLHQVYEDFCNRSGVHKDRAIDFYVKSVEEAVTKRTDKDQKDWLNNVKMEIIQAIRRDIVPDTFLLDVLCPVEGRILADMVVLQEDVHDVP